jgi:hypothetical protein
MAPDGPSSLLRDDLHALVELADDLRFTPRFSSALAARQRGISFAIAELSRSPTRPRGTELCAVDPGARRSIHTRLSFRIPRPAGRDAAPRVLGLRDGDAPAYSSAPSARIGATRSAGYTIVDIYNGVAPGPRGPHLYDLGPERGYQLVGLQRGQT